MACVMLSQRRRRPPDSAELEPEGGLEPPDTINEDEDWPSHSDGYVLRFRSISADPEGCGSVLFGVREHRDNRGRLGNRVRRCEQPGQRAVAQARVGAAGESHRHRQGVCGDPVQVPLLAASSLSSYLYSRLRQ